MNRSKGEIRTIKTDVSRRRNWNDFYMHYAKTRYTTWGFSGVHEKSKGKKGDRWDIFLFFVTLLEDVLVLKRSSTGYRSQDPPSGVYFFSPN